MDVWKCRLSPVTAQLPVSASDNPPPPLALPRHSLCGRAAPGSLTPSGVIQGSAVLTGIGCTRLCVLLLTITGLKIY